MTKLNAFFQRLSAVMVHKYVITLCLAQPTTNKKTINSEIMLQFTQLKHGFTHIDRFETLCWIYSNHSKT